MTAPAVTSPSIPCQAHDLAETPARPAARVPSALWLDLSLLKEGILLWDWGSQTQTPLRAPTCT